MVPVPFKVVPTAVSTLLPAFLQILEAAGESSFGMAMSSVVASSWIASIFSCRRNFSIFSVVKTEKNRTEGGQGSTGDFFLFPLLKKCQNYGDMRISRLFKRLRRWSSQPFRKRLLPGFAETLATVYWLRCGLFWRGQEPLVNKLNFVFFTDSVSELYGQTVYNICPYF
jgi:hypothetical protein